MSEKPEQLDPSHLLYKLSYRKRETKELTASVFLFAMFTSYKNP
jgi:hypothetical protein